MEQHAGLHVVPLLSTYAKCVKLEQIFRPLICTYAVQRTVRDNNFFYNIIMYTQHTQIFTIVEPQWLEHLWDHGNSFETLVVRATEG